MHSPPVKWLQKFQHKLMEENQNLTILSANLLSKSKQAPPGTPPARHEKMSTPLRRQLLALAGKLDTKIPFCVRKEFSELKHSSEEQMSYWTGRAEIVICHGIKLDDSNRDCSFSSFINRFSDKLFHSLNQQN